MLSSYLWFALITNVLSAMVYIVDLLSDKERPRIVKYSVGYDSFGLILAISLAVWVMKCLSLL